MSNANPRVIDLFCGCGGLSEGFEEAGFDIVSGIDIDKDMIRSYCENHPKSISICSDIGKVSCEELVANSGLKCADIELIIGGPPCQGFSTVGNRREDDPRNRLFYQFVRILNEIKPRAFVMENVTGLLTMQKGKVKETILQEFLNLGYNVKYKILNSEDYGVPQKRRRVFFVGHKMAEDRFSFPVPTHEIKKKGSQQTLSGGILQSTPTVWDAIGDLPSLSAGEFSSSYGIEPFTDFQKYLRNGETVLLEHKAPEHSEIMIKRMENIKQGQNHSSLPKELQLKSGYPNIYGRLIADEPADTITGNCGCISAPGRFIHPFDNRVITIREAARLQSFKDSKKFLGSQNKKYKQVGNAVPPLMAKALAIELRKILD